MQIISQINLYYYYPFKKSSKSFFQINGLDLIFFHSEIFSWHPCNWFKSPKKKVTELYLDRGNYENLKRTSFVTSVFFLLKSVFTKWNKNYWSMKREKENAIIYTSLKYGNITQHIGIDYSSCFFHYLGACFSSTSFSVFRPEITGVIQIGIETVTPSKNKNATNLGFLKHAITLGWKQCRLIVTLPKILLWRVVNYL